MWTVVCDDSLARCTRVMLVTLDHLVSRKGIWSGMRITCRDTKERSNWSGGTVVVSRLIFIVTLMLLLVMMMIMEIVISIS